MYKIRLKQILFLLPLILAPLFVAAQENGATRILDTAVAKIKADAGVQMHFTITMNDGTGEEIYDDKGVMKMDGEKYALLTDQMKLWCDGETQWSYIVQNNEIYVSEPNADDARAFSPVHIMQLYKSGFRCELYSAGATAKVDAVKMTAVARDSEIRKAIIFINKQTGQPVELKVDYENGSSADIVVDTYKTKCKFAIKEFRCRVKEYRGAEVVDMR